MSPKFVKFLFIPHYMIALLIFIIMRLLSPFYLIRLFPINSNRIGHFIGNTEVYLTRKIAKMDVPSKPYIDLCYYEIDLKADRPIRWFAYRRLKDLNNMDAIEKEMIQWVDELTEQRKKNPFDEKVANALANGEVSMQIKKNTQ